MSNTATTKTTAAANNPTKKTGFTSKLVPFVPTALFDRVRAEAEARRLVANAVIICGWLLAQIDPALLVYEMAYQRSRNKRISAAKLAAHYVPIAEAPIIVNYRDGLFVVTDGCHRTMHALETGRGLVTVLVHLDANGNGISFEDEAKAFSNQNSGTVEMKQHDTFAANLICGERVDTDISKVCTQFCISVTRNTKTSENDVCLTALNEARKITKDHGYKGFHWCISTIDECGWLGRGGLNNYVLKAMRQVYRKHDLAGDLNAAHDNIVGSFLGFDLPALRVELAAAWPHYPDVRKAIPLLVNCVADGKIVLDSNCNLPVVAQLRAYKDTVMQYVEEKHRNGNADAKQKNADDAKDGKPAVVRKTKK